MLKTRRKQLQKTYRQCGHCERCSVSHLYRANTRRCHSNCKALSNSVDRAWHLVTASCCHSNCKCKSIKFNGPSLHHSLTTTPHRSGTCQESIYSMSQKTSPYSLNCHGGAISVFHMLSRILNTLCLTDVHFLCHFASSFNSGVNSELISGPTD